MGTFDYKVNYDTAPVGSVIQSPINLETVTNGKWIALDGRDCNRSDYPELAPYFPAGVFTSTARTLNGTPVVSVAAADSTNFLAPGAAGTSPLQASPDGITWSTSATWTAATSPASLIVSGTRYVMAGSGGDLTAPYVSTTGQTAANQVAKANWTATTGGTTTTLTQGLAYSPQLGVTVLVPSSGGTTYYYLADGATAWTTGTGTSATKTAVCWTGKKFIALVVSDYIQTNSTGTGAWTDQYLPNSYNVGSTSIASNGNGIVVTEGLSTGQLNVSLDHGATWRRIKLPVEAFAGDGGTHTALTAQIVNFVNGKFILTWAGQTRPQVISYDGLNWFVEKISRRANAAHISINGQIAYKSGVYVGVTTSTTAALSATEDMSKFRLPIEYNGGVTTTALPLLPVNTWPSYIKARS